ncbi:MAG: hypothetical protein ACOC0Z_07345, partial [Halohasta sp.]
AVFGIALGILAFVSGSWAQSQLVTDAGGAADFGPVFIAVAYLQTAVVILFLGPVIAALVGGLLSSIISSPKVAFVIGGAGSLVGFYIMSLIAIGILVLSKGSNASQAFSFGQVLVPMLVAGLPTALMGAVVSAVSSAID